MGLWVRVPSSLLKGNKMLIKITIPISNYYNDGVFYQDIYFDSDHSPSKDEVLSYLQEMSERDSKWSEYLGTWEDAINSVNNTEDWPIIGGKKIGSNTFVNREDLQKFQTNLPLSMLVIQPKIL